MEVSRKFTVKWWIVVKTFFKKNSPVNLIFRPVQVVAGEGEDLLNITDYHIEVNSVDSSSNVMFKIEDGAESIFCEELDVGEHNINNNDDEYHGTTYEI